MAVDQLVAPPPIAGSTRPDQNKIGFGSQMWRLVGAKTAAGWPEVALHGIGGGGALRRAGGKITGGSERADSRPLIALISLRSAPQRRNTTPSFHHPAIVEGSTIRVISSEWLEAGGGQRLAPL